MSDYTEERFRNIDKKIKELEEHVKSNSSDMGWLLLFIIILALSCC